MYDVNGDLETSLQFPKFALTIPYQNMKPHRVGQTNRPAPRPNLARHRRSRQTFGFAGFKLQEGTQSMQHAYKTDYRTVDHMQKGTDLNKING